MKKIFLVNQNNIAADANKFKDRCSTLTYNTIIDKIKKNVLEEYLVEDNHEIYIQDVSDGKQNKVYSVLFSKVLSNPNEDKLKFLGEISTNLFHELRTPLNILTSSIELLRMESQDSNYEDLKRLVEERMSQCENGALKIFNIIKGIQNFAQGKSEPKVRSVKEFVQEAVSFSEMFLKQNKISIKLTNELVDSHTKILIEENLLSQVIVNLIKNSSDSIKNLPQFNRWIEVIVKDSDKDILISLIDSGSGISIENQKKLFTYGFTTKPVGEGFGIGLNLQKDC